MKTLCLSWGAEMKLVCAVCGSILVAVSQDSEIVLVFPCQVCLGKEYEAGQVGLYEEKKLCKEFKDFPYRNSYREGW